LIKPLLLYSLLQGDMTLASVVRDEPVRIKQSNGELWEPRNYDRKLHGKMSLYQAFLHSYNLPFIWLGVNAGGLEALAQNLSKIHLLKHDVVFPSMLLGTTEMSAYEVAQMFQVIANDGYFTPLTTIRSVTDQQNRALSRIPLESLKLFDQATMIQVQRAMVGVSEQGTARYLAQRFGEHSLAGKTGTTNDQVDALFSGYNDQVVTTAWVGFDNQRHMGRRETGGRAALPMWINFMRVALDGMPENLQEQPEGLVTIRIDAETGKRAYSGTTKSLFELFREENAPRQKAVVKSNSGSTNGIVVNVPESEDEIVEDIF
jgi:membrane carboxypeptidase/penicillin-binding protein